MTRLGERGEKTLWTERGGRDGDLWGGDSIREQASLAWDPWLGGEEMLEGAAWLPEGSAIYATSETIYNNERINLDSSKFLRE